jgi:hypothetical protein
MMLTAAAVVVGASVVLFDPIFQGLAISLMAGEIASLFLSRTTVPVVYFLTMRRKQEGKGTELPAPRATEKKVVEVERRGDPSAYS